MKQNKKTQNVYREYENDFSGEVWKAGTTFQVFIGKHTWLWPKLPLVFSIGFALGLYDTGIGELFPTLSIELIAAPIIAAAVLGYFFGNGLGLPLGKKTSTIPGIIDNENLVEENDVIVQTIQTSTGNPSIPLSSGSWIDAPSHNKDNSN